MRRVPDLLHFVEVSTFSATAAGLLDDDDLRMLQQILIHDPEVGVVVPRTGGIRKLRIATRGRGKRGGGRVIYLYVEVRSRVYLLAVFAKNDKPDLTAREYQALASLVKRLKMER